ncbi:diguanylate cyclase domain-containing protein [Pseudomonas zhanjiangensis]|uniref:Diguanylate cyclase n=1 Tax=Pseudomonas zhanjiangensis TaxID=3239015 RepID=A0ABV3YYA8_9PSED
MLLILIASAGALLPLALVAMLVRRECHAREQLAQYRSLVERLPEGVLQVARDGRISRHNPAAARLLGHGEAALIGKRLADCLPQLSGLAGDLPQRLNPGEGDEGNRPALEVVRLGPAESDAGILLIQPAGTAGRSTDDAERFKRSQYFARIGTWDWRIDTDELYWSDAIYGMFGYRVGEVTPSYELFCASVHPQDQEQVRAGELRCIETGENHDEEYRVVWPDGTVRWLRETGNVLKDADGNAVRMMGVVRDITEEKHWLNQLQDLAHLDSLTGLPNRLVFEAHLGKALERARRNQTRVALVFIDLNGFKAINDRHGHAAGDKLLQVTGARLSQTLRESDTVARLGGDEFVAILEAIPPQQPLAQEAESVSRKILDALTAPVLIDEAPLRVGASLGIAVFPDHAPSMDKLIHIADLAMYEAKRSGNNQYRLGSTPRRNAPSFED